MCGRFNIANTPGLEALLDSLGHDLQLPQPRFNVAPTEPVPLVFNGTLREARWWLTPHWAKSVEQKYSMFNARCERLADSPAFRKPFRSQRGIVPMSSFIEWRASESGKVPWLISNDNQALAVAALWDVWGGTPDNAEEAKASVENGEGEPLLSCTLVTTDAAPQLRPWHHRMPVVLGPGEYERWLDNTHTIESDDPLFRAQLKMPLQLYPLDNSVGNSRRKAPELMASVGETVILDDPA